MTEHLRLLAKQLKHLKQMLKYLEYSEQRVQHILPITNWQDLSFEQHETLAAFRVRFSEFQKHLGKTCEQLLSKKRLKQNALVLFSLSWKNWGSSKQLSAGNSSASSETQLITNTKKTLNASRNSFWKHFKLRQNCLLISKNSGRHHRASCAY
jgi:hypothetical protein